jgi:hypothetical protein
MSELLDKRPSLHPTAAVERVGDRLMVATDDDRLHVLASEANSPSEVGERIVALSDGQRTVRDIAQVVFEEFEVDLDTALSDTAGFVELLVERKVLILDRSTAQRAASEGSSTR